MTPILVTCKDRLRYLDTTLMSLSASIPNEVEVYIADDGSTNPDIIRYLTTNDEIAINDHQFPNNIEWTQKIGNIPNNKHTTGVKGKVNVLLKRPPSEGVRTFTWAIRHIFLKHDCAHVIKIQDDVLFKPNWYHTITQTTPKEIGLVSGFRYFFDHPQLVTINKHLDKLEHGHVGGLLMMVSATLCKNNPVLMKNNLVQLRDMDDFWTDNCKKAGMWVGITKNGLCQHIGHQSLIYSQGPKQFMLHGTNITRIDQELLPPYALGTSVKCMTQEGTQALIPQLSHL